MSTNTIIGNKRKVAAADWAQEELEDQLSRLEELEMVKEIFGEVLFPSDTEVRMGVYILKSSHCPIHNGHHEGVDYPLSVHVYRCFGEMKLTCHYYEYEGSLCDQQAWRTAFYDSWGLREIFPEAPENISALLTLQPYCDNDFLAGAFQKVFHDKYRVFENGWIKRSDRVWAPVNANDVAHDVGNLLSMMYSTIARKASEWGEHSCVGPDEKFTKLMGDLAKHCQNPENISEIVSMARSDEDDSSLESNDSESDPPAAAYAAPSADE